MATSSEPFSRPDDEPGDSIWAWNDFSLATDDAAMLLRRLCMWAVFVSRTALSILRLWYHLTGTSILAISWDIISLVADFLVTGVSLAQISRVKGIRRIPVFGLRLNRRRFDIFLFLCAVHYIVILTMTLDGWWKVSYDSWSMLWYALPQILATRTQEELGQVKA
ncbi:hypothetical protein CDV31_012925 [Fusarium ambrosium]|uniref:Uncharacterized protein n=1 Tax=Fusarium ambrosium TaxID=131363 RepID=A0A428T6P5_9HYPO|nr:hypothetical protein CDV31_012925 [Fusarium ambrosium]